MKTFKKTKLFLFALMVSALIYACKNLHQSSTEENNVDISYTELTPEENVKAVLQIRKDIIYQNWVDSVFTNMPIEAVIIISYDNPSFNLYDIVNEYALHKLHYDEILRNHNIIQKIEAITQNTDSSTTTPIDDDLHVE